MTRMGGPLDLVALLLAGVVLGSSSCMVFPSCTERGCSTGVTLTFTSPLPEGQHVLEVTVPEGTATCTLSITAQTLEGDCDGGLQIDLSSYWLLIRGTPAEATVRLTTNDEHVGTAWVSNLEYDDDFPNGEGCPGHCQVAEREIEFIVR